MNESYTVPIGNNLSLNNSWERPADPSIINKFISAIPSSICCPSEEKTHFWADGIFRSLNISEVSFILNNNFIFIKDTILLENLEL